MPDQTKSKTSEITSMFFDWDGTVVDSAHLGLAAYEKAFAELGFPFDHEVYRAAYSPNWLAVYEGLGLPKEHWQRADELWTQHYGEERAELIAGVAETIAELRSRGYRLGVVSSGNYARVIQEADELALGGCFEVVVCHEQITNRKPHPEGLQIAMRLLGSAPNETCYVGDTPEDIEMGRSAGALTVGVRSAYPTSWKLANNLPDIYLKSLPEILTHF